MLAARVDPDTSASASAAAVVTRYRLSASAQRSSSAATTGPAAARAGPAKKRPKPRTAAAESPVGGRNGVPHDPWYGESRRRCRGRRSRSRGPWRTSSPHTSAGAGRARADRGGRRERVAIRPVGVERAVGPPSVHGGAAGRVPVPRLRHFYARLLIARGANVKVVKARLRHAWASATLDSYSHCGPTQTGRRGPP